MPTGKRLDDGHSTKIEFSMTPNVALWEKTVKPPGLDGGDPNDTTTMRNTVYRTMAPRKLKTLTPVTVKCAYDEGDYANILAMININQLVGVRWPTGRPWTFWAYLRSFEPDENQEGAQPTATVVIQPTMQDASGAEVALVVGTTTSTTTTTTTTT